ncbi:GntR family transcriptional regulator [Lacticaseibacillus mingshuiensis]|uniref:GntR family transcriptional regulator n=1 Tax=Lacticaseibacillus mingshuiensis TaxID=2799574 RepID=A0ABW4CGC0_9LACO|nr:GntR family transcriptional regulator [Lacticaseibacillus mingshuiensis]
MDDQQFSHLAYYERLVLDVKQQITTGVLRPGDKLPSVREMAQQVKLNPNTVAKAYKQLEADHVVEMRPGLGSFIAEPDDAAQQAAANVVRPKVEAAVLEACAAGVSEGTVRGWLAQIYARQGGQTNGIDR